MQATNPKKKKNESGIALFMVMSTMSILAILVTEFTWVAQVNQRVAYDGLDQIQAQYLAKSGLKISFLRLKAYQILKGFAAKQGLPVPRSVLDKIWNFPFMYPIPTEIPGLTGTQKDGIKKFQEASSLQGHFTAVIESESSKFNINQIVAEIVPRPSPSPSKSPNPNPSPSASASPKPAPSFDPVAARNNLSQLLGDIFKNKAEKDQDFAEEYRDFKVEELMDEIFAWADYTYERRNAGKFQTFKAKGAPFYSVNELHMLDHMDDKLFDLFAPHLTASATIGVNVNTVREEALRALLPKMTDDESKEFFKKRDDPEADNSFKKPDDFFQYIKENVAAYGGDKGIEFLKEDLATRRLEILVDETNFKITVQAKVNQASKLIEAWVTLTEPESNKPPSGGAGKAKPGAPEGNATFQNFKNDAEDSGLRVTFMRTL